MVFILLVACPPVDDDALRGPRPACVLPPLMIRHPVVRSLTPHPVVGAVALEPPRSPAALRQPVCLLLVDFVLCHGVVVGCWRSLSGPRRRNLAGFHAPAGVSFVRAVNDNSDDDAINDEACADREMARSRNRSVFDHVGGDDLPRRCGGESKRRWSCRCSVGAVRPCRLSTWRERRLFCF